MYNYEKRLQYPVKITKTNPKGHCINSKYYCDTMALSIP